MFLFGGVLLWCVFRGVGARSLRCARANLLFSPNASCHSDLAITLLTIVTPSATMVKVLVILCLLSMTLLVRSLTVGRAGLMTRMLRSRAGALPLSSMSTSSTIVSEITLTTQSTTAEKLRMLRQAMNKASIECFIVPTDDPHMSEYTALYYNRREWLSGFTGSAGTVIVTKNEALLFTDGRYHNQAELELTKDWTLMRQGNKDVPAPIEWMSTRLPSGSVVGVDPFVHAALNMKKIQSELSAKHITVKSLSENPIDTLWTEKQVP